MTEIRNLETYLEKYRGRLKQLAMARGLAIAISVFVIVALVASQLAISSGFADSWVWAGRVALLAVIGASIWLIAYFLKNLLHTRFAREIEQRSPQFAGRVQTFMSASADKANPMRELLAEDALKIATANPPEIAITNRQIRVPQGIAAGAALVFLVALMLAPGLTSYSLRHLVAGWAIGGLLPPQTIAATPGDQLIRRGGNLRIQADASGFQPSEASLFVRMGDGEWQEVGMTPLPDAGEGARSFDFRLFSVREPMTYYVSAMGIRSPNYGIEVVDLPGIKNLQVTYNYPEWTGLEPETREQGGDIDALPDTGIQLTLTTDHPLPAGELVLNGEALAMDVDGLTGMANFVIEEDGEYFLAARIGSEQVRLSDDYFIRVLEDNKPEIEFVTPGRDRNATNIEEVVADLRVEDDYRLEKVELRYAVNGGEWQSVELSTENRVENLEHIFYLEEIQTPVEQPAVALTTEAQIGEALISGTGIEPDTLTPELTNLVPGDLISYYALAEDRRSQAQTDMFFIEVQPFDRRISRAEQGGGGAGMAGGQGASEQEISQRQKEIVISTWNLIRDRSDAQAVTDQDLVAENRISDSARLLSGLQSTLQEQAQSLLDTAQARRLDGDPRVSTFIDHMQKAIAAMTPASERLAVIDLETAIQPEQEALQHLLRADAVFNDIQISLNQGGQGAGGGGGAAQDLAEMMELEIDFEQNQYETGSQASRQSPAQEAEDAMRELAELARRQQQLAESLNRTNQPTEAQRWQQEMLRREAEAIRERLDRMQQSSQGQQAGQSGQTDQSQQAGSGSDANQSGNTGDSAGTDTESTELNRRLQSALDAMDRASEAMRSGDSNQLQQAAGEAQRQLEGAGSQLEEDQQASLQRAFAEMADRAAALHRDQESMEETLLDGVQRAIASAPEGATSVVNPFGWEEEQDFADAKREMIAELQRLQGDMQVNADRVRSDVPNVARIIDQADRDLKDSEISVRMDIAANYMSRGESLYVANSESIVTRSLDDLSDSLREAERALSGGAGEQSALDSLLSDIRQSGRALRDASGNESGQTPQSGQGGEQSGQSGQQGGQQTGQEQQQAGQGQQSGAQGQASTGSPSQQSGQSGQAGQGGQGSQGGEGSLAGGPQGGANSGQTAGGGNVGGFAGGWTGGWSQAPGGNIGDAETQLGELRAGIGNLVPELRARGFSEDRVAEISQLVRQLQNASLNGDLNNRMELNRTLALLEQLERAVESTMSGNSGRVRSESPISIQPEFKEAVADYYRRLSDDNDKPDSTDNLR